MKPCQCKLIGYCCPEISLIGYNTYYKKASDSQLCCLT